MSTPKNSAATSGSSSKKTSENHAAPATPPATPAEPTSLAGPTAAAPQEMPAPLQAGEGIVVHGVDAPKVPLVPAGSRRDPADESIPRREASASPEPGPRSPGPQPAPRPRASPPPPKPPMAENNVAPRRAQFMLSPRSHGGLQPMSADFVAGQLRGSPDIDVVKTIQPPRLLGLQSAEGEGLSSLVLARMTFDKAALLQKQAGAGLMVERDRPLTFTLDRTGPIAPAFNPSVMVPHADGFQATFEIRGPQGPLAAAEVYLFGSVWPSQGVTDAAGRVVIAVPGESPDTIGALYVKPKTDHWSYWLPRPTIDPDGLNVVVVKPLGAFLSGFPDHQLLGWGQIAMGLDKVPPSYDGAGVKVAVIDSGAARESHRNLHNAGPGLSVVSGDRANWVNDSIGHGSHCAGIISGGPVGAGSVGIRGFAPAAQVHVLQIFPGGRFSHLVEALDYCMENEIDVVNMSLGGGEPSKIIEERIIRAKQMGVACIVAAGNSGGPVQFPASTPHVLAVAACGRSGSFPEDSFHADQILPGQQAQDGTFIAKFSCFGPEIDVCAPGVAIVSSLPPDGFGAWDGTSMATPHVTGLAALVLAHHPDFTGSYQAKDGRRVERLFQILKETAAPMPFAERDRAGAGMPHAARALGLELEAANAPPQAGLAVTREQAELLKKLLSALSGAAPSRDASQHEASTGLFTPQSAGPAAMDARRPARDEDWPSPQTARGAAGTNGSGRQDNGYALNGGERASPDLRARLSDLRTHISRAGLA